MEPRNLSEAEIKDITSRFYTDQPDDPFGGKLRRNLTPDQQRELDDFYLSYVVVPGATSEVRELARQELVNFLTNQLQEIRITPIGIPTLRDDILTQYRRSLIEPGTTVGVAAGAALGAQATQSALNSFHQSGSNRNISSGVRAYQEIFNVSQNRKNESCTVHLRDKNKSFDQWLAYRSELVNYTVADLVEDYENVDLVSALPQYWWRDAYLTTMGRSIPKSMWVLRLYMNINRMFESKIRIEDVAAKIEMGSPASVICIPSPQTFVVPAITDDNGKIIKPARLRAIIDIYPEESVFLGTLQTMSIQVPEIKAPLIFLSSIVQPNLVKINISGVPGIKQVFPVPNPVWQIVREEVKVFNTEQENAVRAQYPQYADLMARSWYLIFNRQRMLITGISRDNLQKLATETGIQWQRNPTDPADPITILSSLFQFNLDSPNPNYMFVIMPEIPATAQETENKKDAQYRRNLTRPGSWVQYLVEADQADETQYEREQKSRGVLLFRRPPTPLMRAANYVIGETDGTNLPALLIRPDIDPYYTYCNNVHVIYACFGIEAARNFLILELSNLIANEGSYINSRHITLMVDFITNLGIPTPITFSGIARHEIGTMSLVTIQRAMDTFRDAAAMGREDTVNAVSEGIFLGQRGQFGSGYLDVKINEDLLAQFAPELETLQESTIDIDPTNLDAAIATLDEHSFSGQELGFSTDVEDGLSNLLGVPTVSETSGPSIVADRNTTSIPRLPTIGLPLVRPQQLTAVVGAPIVSNEPVSAAITAPGSTVEVKQTAVNRFRRNK